MFKRCISYVIIFSLLWADCASCMKGAPRSELDDERQSSPRHHSIQIQKKIPAADPHQEASLVQNVDIQQESLRGSLIHNIGVHQEVQEALLVQGINPQQIPQEPSLIQGINAQPEIQELPLVQKTDTQPAVPIGESSSTSSHNPENEASSSSGISQEKAEGEQCNNTALSSASPAEGDVHDPSLSPHDTQSVLSQGESQGDQDQSSPPSPSPSSGQNQGNPSSHAEFKNLGDSEGRALKSRSSSRSDARRSLSLDHHYNQGEGEGDIEMDDMAIQMGFVVVDCNVKEKRQPKDSSYDPEDPSASEAAPLLKTKPKDKQNRIRAQTYLQEEHINPQDFTSEQLKALGEILDIEGSWKNPLVWSNLQSQLSRLWFALFTNKSAVNGEKNERGSLRLWLHGGPLPLNSERHIKQNITLKTLGNGFEEGTMESLHAVLTALLGYQIYQGITSHSLSGNFFNILKFYEDADSTSYLGIIRALHANPILFAIGAVPFGFAFLKALWSFSQISHPTEEDVQKSIQKLKSTSLKWDAKIVNGLYIVPVLSLFLEFPFLSYLYWHPIKNNIPSLAHLILWDGRLPSKTREEAFNAILELAQKRAGLSQMAAIESLSRIAHGFHTSNLHLRPQDKEDLLKIKLRAFCALKDIYKELPFSLNKILTGVLLWERGQSPSWVISLGEPVIKALRAALYVYTFYGLGKVLYDYFTCPEKYLENFTWLGGTTPYASDYSQACFDAQVQVFNTLPGQPASTLVGNLTQYHFPNNSYNLDLSNKGIEGPVIAEIVEEFQNARIFLNSLNITGNTITNSSDIARILAALPPEIVNLNMASLYNFGNIPQNFSGLSRLTSLQSLDLSNNLFPLFTNATETLQAISHLQELNLGMSIFNLTQIAQAIKRSFVVLDISQAVSNCFDQIALGKAFAQNSNFQQLYLSNTINCTDEALQNEAYVTFAQGLTIQHNLSVLDLSSNGLGNQEGLPILLKSLPSSLTSLDVSNNSIGLFNDLAVEGLAEAVAQMPGLTTFAGAFNELGNSPSLLEALHDKKNLAYLDLAVNNLTNTPQVRDLLWTIPNLQLLGLSDNLLTNGSILAPPLSKLSTLQTLALENNPFTTADRIAIANASFFLASPPFSLYEDLNFTTYYLNSLPPTTHSLSFAGLLPSNPGFLYKILPQVLSLFPNLTTLDFSDNY